MKCKCVFGDKDANLSVSHELLPGMEIRGCRKGGERCEWKGTLYSCHKFALMVRDGFLYP